jgi:hypothetical protein
MQIPHFLHGLQFLWFSEEKSPTLAEHDLVTEFASIIMTEKDETPQKLADRLTKENQKLRAEEQYHSHRLATLMRSAMSRSTWSKDLQLPIGRESRLLIWFKKEVINCDPPAALRARIQQLQTEIPSMRM